MAVEVVCSKCGPQLLENLICTNCGWSSLRITTTLSENHNGSIPTAIHRIIDDINRTIPEAYKEDDLPTMVKLTEARQKLEEIGRLLNPKPLLLQQPKSI